MKLKLLKNLIVLDVETTGLSVSKDRIVQLALIKIFADGRKSEERCRLINPEIPIPAETTAIHGITDEMVRDQPTLARLGKGIVDFIGDADFATYNGNRFDIPILIQEFHRIGIPLDMTGRKTIDVQRIFHKREPRTLSAAYRFYLNEKLDGAHDAGKDARATLKILEAQIIRYEGTDVEENDGTVISNPVRNDMRALHDFTTDPHELDFQGKVKLNAEGVAVLTFGKFQGKPVGESLHGDPKYHQWIQNGDFTVDTKSVIQRLVDEYAVLVR